MTYWGLNIAVIRLEGSSVVFVASGRWRGVRLGQGGLKTVWVRDIGGNRRLSVRAVTRFIDFCKVVFNLRGVGVAAH